MRFICKNPECDRFDIEDVEPNVIIGFKDGKIVYDRTPCPVCKQDRDYVVPESINLRDKNVMVKAQFGSVNKKWWSKSSKGTIY